MNYLLDTNVISEWMKPQPNAGVVEFLNSAGEDSIFLSVVTITEVRYGIERIPTGGRRKRLDEWLRNELLPRFDGRLIPVDLAVADACGRLVARSESVGRPIEPRDAFIAATAEVFQLTLVTRNASDFQPTLKMILCPWS